MKIRGQNQIGTIREHFTDVVPAAENFDSLPNSTNDWNGMSVIPRTIVELIDGVVQMVVVASRGSDVHIPICERVR